MRTSALLAAAALAAAASPAAPARAAAPASPKAGAPHRPKAPPPVAITLAPSLLAGPAVGVTMAPAGLSIEYPVMAADLGSGACPPPALIAELQRLGSPPLELGGQSQDFTLPAEAAAGPPSSWEAVTSYRLPAAFWSQLHCLLAASPDPLTVGLNARIGSIEWAQRMVADAEAAAPAPPSFSLGNEPDLYYLPDYASLDKPQPGEEAIDAERYLQVATSLRPALGSAPLVGPELARPSHWHAQLARVIATLHEQTVGVHAYPLSVCSTPRAATLGGLLARTVGEAPRRIAWVAAEAGAAGAPAILSEANSVSCGGKPGVSDAPASAVWAVRFVLSALESGFREVRFHFSGNSYDPFSLRGGAVLRRPLEGAIADLNQWLPVGASIHRVPLGTQLLGSAVGTAAGGLMLILDNESTRAVHVRLGGQRAVHVSMLRPLAGAAGIGLTAVGGHIALTLPAEAVAAITPMSEAASSSSACSASIVSAM